MRQSTPLPSPAPASAPAPVAVGVCHPSGSGDTARAGRPARVVRVSAHLLTAADGGAWRVVMSARPGGWQRVADRRQTRHLSHRRPPQTRQIWSPSLVVRRTVSYCEMEGQDAIR